MVTLSSLRMGLNPTIFNGLDTPYLTFPDRAVVNDGLPAYAKLEVMVAYLTAHNNLNYEAIEDFFLTYRKFASPVAIWDLLCSRLLWAADVAARTGSESDLGHDVGTRCFVALRHWIVTYFEDDFVPDYELRSLVAESLTKLSGCTEFVLLKHFEHILSRLRHLWDMHLARFWDIPSSMIGNSDYPVPIGGEELPHNYPTQVPVNSFADIPIDADIGVSSIRISRQQKPRHRISRMFTSSTHEKPLKDVVLHDKVDFLAMSVINEFYKSSRADVGDEFDRTSESQHTIRQATNEQEDVEALSDQSSITEQSNLDNEAAADLRLREAEAQSEHLASVDMESHGLELRSVDDGNLVLHSVVIPHSTIRDENSDRPTGDESVAMNVLEVHETFVGVPLEHSVDRILSESEGANGDSVQLNGSSLRTDSEIVESEHGDGVFGKERERQASGGNSEEEPVRNDTGTDIDLSGADSDDSHELGTVPNSVLAAVKRESPTGVESIEHPADDTSSHSSQAAFEDATGSTDDIHSGGAPYPEDDTPMEDEDEDFEEDLDSDHQRFSSEGYVTEQEVESGGPDQQNFTHDAGEVSYDRDLPSSISVDDDNEEEDDHVQRLQVHDDRAGSRGSDIIENVHSVEMDTTNELIDRTPYEEQSEPIIQSWDHEDSYLDDSGASPTGLRFANQIPPQWTRSSTEFPLKELMREKSMNNLASALQAINVSSSELSAEPVYDNWDTVDMNNFDAVSYSGSSLTTISRTSQSHFSTRGSTCDNESIVVERRCVNRTSLDDVSISLLSEIDNSLLRPCAGYTDEDAERLKAIPDKKIEGDAILATLQELEGRAPDSAISICSRSVEELALAGSGRIVRSNTEDLYAAALTSQSNVSDTPYTQVHIAAHHFQPQLFSNRLASSGQSHQHYLPETAQPGSKSHMPSQAYRYLESEVSGLQISGILKPRSAGMGHGDRQRLSTSTLKKEEHTIPMQIKFTEPSLHIGLPDCSHAPFVLAYGSQEIAEQMTIIAKDIVAGICSQDLVSLDAMPTPDLARSWLSVVTQATELSDVDVYIIRSQLTSRWVESEILLCGTPALEAQTVCKFLHISFECLRLQNLATMFEIMSAIQSLKSKQLLKTEVFELLQDQDKSLCERFLRLISPDSNNSALRNVHNGIDVSRGSVPVVSLFLRDLAVTSEARSVNSEIEIHFDKYRVAAKIAKSLQTIIKSGQNYHLQRRQSLLSKCLYISSLPLDYQPYGIS